MHEDYRNKGGGSLIIKIYSHIYTRQHWTFKSRKERKEEDDKMRRTYIDRTKHEREREGEREKTKSDQA